MAGTVHILFFILMGMMPWSVCASLEVNIIAGILNSSDDLLSDGDDVENPLYHTKRGENPLFDSEASHKFYISRLQKAEQAKDLVRPAGDIRPGELRSRARSRSDSTSSFSSPEASQRTLRMSMPAVEPFISDIHHEGHEDETELESVSGDERESFQTQSAHSLELSRESAESVDEKRLSATSQVDTESSEDLASSVDESFEGEEIGAGALFVHEEIPRESLVVRVRTAEQGVKTESEEKAPELHRHGSGQKSRRALVDSKKAGFGVVAKEHLSELTNSQDIQEAIEDLTRQKNELDGEQKKSAHTQKVIRLQIMHILLEQKYWLQQLECKEYDEEVELDAEEKKVDVKTYIDCHLQALLDELQEVKKEQDDLQFDDKIRQARLEELEFTLNFLDQKLQKLIARDKKEIQKREKFVQQDSYGSWLWKKVFGAPSESEQDKARRVSLARRRQSLAAKKDSHQDLKRLKSTTALQSDIL